MKRRDVDGTCVPADFGTSGRQAFTLTEILFSMLILAVAVTTVMGLLAAGAKRHGLERDREIANQLAVTIGEAAFLQSAPTLAPYDVVEAALLNPRANLVELPPALARRLRSADGSLERAIGLRQKVVYLGPFSGHRADEGQLRVIAAFVTTDGTAAVPAGTTWSPHLACRTLVCWSADWPSLEDCEFGIDGGGNLTSAVHVDRDGDGTWDYGPVAASSIIEAVEVGRFNCYDPHLTLTLQGAP